MLNFVSRYPGTKECKIKETVVPTRIVTCTNFCKESLGKMHGRKCRQLGLRCADCGQPAKILVTEEDGQSWLYCGKCEIGGC